MKKLLVLFVAVLLVMCGCGKEDVIATNTCSIEEENTSTVIKMTATNDEIDKVVITVTPDNSLFGVDSLDILDDSQKEQVKSAMLSTLGIEENTEGLDINIEINDTMVVIVEADLKVADPTVLKKIGLDFDGQDMSLENNVKQMKDEGYTCK